MAIPTYQQIMLPLLQLAQDGKTYSMNEITEAMANYFNLSNEERECRLPTGHATYIKDRTSWARTYLIKAGLLTLPSRGYMQITAQGLKVLKEKPKQIDREYLKRFPDFLEFINFNRSESIAVENISNQQTPEETIEESYKILRATLAQDLLEQIKKCSPGFFEQLIIDLLLTMGYGGSRREAGKVVGKSGDGGIDGIIHQDKLGLDVIYLQAKRWQSSVGAPEIRNFVGSLTGHKATQGVFVTTSSYTPAALDYVKTVHHKVILIDGNRLVDLMIEHNVGVTKHNNYEVKKINSSYFSEE